MFSEMPGGKKKGSWKYTANVGAGGAAVIYLQIIT
jgi:hypothetical protein